MRVALDLDGTVVDFMGAVCQQHNIEQGTRLTESDIVAWDFLPLTVFPTWADFWPWVQDRHLFLKAVAYPGAVETVRRWMTATDHRIVAVTHRPRWAEEDTRTWLLRHRILPEIVWADDKTLLDFDLWIDDSPDVLARLAQRGSHVIRMIRPWNHPIAGIADASDWNSPPLSDIR